jgi:hypothetical protein
MMVSFYTLDGDLCTNTCTDVTGYFIDSFVLKENSDDFAYVGF